MSEELKKQLAAEQAKNGKLTKTNQKLEATADKVAELTSENETLRDLLEKESEPVPDISAPGLKKFKLSDYAINRLRKNYFMRAGKKFWLNHPELKHENITDEVVEQIYGDDEGNFRQKGCVLFEPA